MVKFIMPRHMDIETLVVGSLQTNCYIVGCPDQKAGVVIDPGGDAELVLAAIQRADLDILYVVNTHAHIDHTLANSQVLEATGARLAIHEIDAPTLKDPQGNLSFFIGRNPPQKPPNWELKAGDRIEFGNIVLTVLHTPGHTPGGITLFSDGVAFTGDTLFNRGVGRTDLPGGDWPTLENSILQQLFTLPDDTIVFPGHGPKTTIGDEKRLNPYIQMLGQG